MNDDKLKTFLSGAVPGYFTGLYFLFDNTAVGQYAVIANILKIFMAFSLAAATGMGTLVGQYVYKKIKIIIRKRKIKKYAKQRDQRRRA